MTWLSKHKEKTWILIKIWWQVIIHLVIEGKTEIKMEMFIKNKIRVAIHKEKLQYKEFKQIEYLFYKKKQNI